MTKAVNTLNIPGEPELSEALTRVVRNIFRASSLLSIYKTIQSLKEERRGRINTTDSDILRSSVVLLHASLEDGLRSLLRYRLPRNKETFDKIALYGLNKSGKPEKFWLGDLHNFRGKTIEEIWNESLEGHLSQKSFNNREDIIYALNQIGIYNEIMFEPLLGPIAQLTSRRHHIVHNADINEKKGGRGQQFARTIQRKQVEDWIDVVRKFFVVSAFLIQNPHTENHSSTL